MHSSTVLKHDHTRKSVTSPIPYRPRGVFRDDADPAIDPGTHQSRYGR